MERLGLDNGNKASFTIVANRFDETSKTWVSFMKIVEMTKEEILSITRAMCLVDGGAMDPEELNRDLGQFMEPGKYKDIKVCME